MPEHSHTHEQHGEPSLICGGNNLKVLHQTTRLNNRGDARSCRCLRPPSEKGKSVFEANKAYPKNIALLQQVAEFFFVQYLYPQLLCLLKFASRLFTRQ